MAGLQIKQLVKSYGAMSVLHGIDLDVHDGEFLVLIGPSGCGKSTLLRMIAGLDDISSGELWIGNRLTNGLAPQQRNISMVFQSYALFPHMTTRKNIGFGPKIRREAGDVIDAKVNKAAETLNLHDYLDRLPRQLSGGQRQRVAMGRTIVREPDLFLFDEPLSNLDAKLRVQMRTEIKALHQQLKTTIVYVTHDQMEAMTMADRIVVMNGGRIEQIGSPLELYDRPANKFVAGFLGSPAMSFIPGTLERGDGVARMRTAEGFIIPVGDTTAASGQPVELGIRPEHYRLAASGQGFPYKVAVVEPTGSETHLFGTIAGVGVRAVFRDRVAPEPGSQMMLTVNPDKVHVFDGKTGNRI
ncbi:sn-glycerol-3-phosphate ABC transporter ATP-binding protein UgpC [Phyllobacterium sp. P30BS-XVII]|uniref:ABC transporter ATP-binding protein n=1 Tax=Phyllobacterium sp. P30BS-XVII TaxID=2587046 RepID=UPI0015FB9AF8|nr:sn-glycerol-3-phosphate ABC transporter ATP-binding protein UgpC [Phyllobacterium sp. P30BS-XVII]MBA8902020.1 multiple sugar transport system ATP-binding protein [Phyllobacterium sp. P30BS-XVII]